MSTEEIKTTAVEELPAADPISSPIKEIDAVLEKAKETARSRDVIVAQPKRKKLRPRGDWVVIRKVQAKDRLYSSGLVITEGQARSSVGEVVSIPTPEWWKRWFNLSPAGDLRRGDLVVYTNFATQLEELEDATGDKNLFLVRQEEVYAALDDEE